MKRLFKDMYEAPMAEVLVVKMEASLLQGSVVATRDDYGEAVSDTWE